MRKEFDVLLLDVDGTLMDFNMAEKRGMEQVLRFYGLEPTTERLDRYHVINEKAWAAFERGETTKEKLVTERFVTFFGEMGSTQYKRLAVSGLDQYVKDIFVSEDAGSQKPQTEYFDK